MKKHSSVGFRKTSSNAIHRKRVRSMSVLLLYSVIGILPIRAQSQPQPPGSTPSPEPAIAAIVAAFDKYEVVAMPEAHGMKDVDDFIFALVRTPAFLERVNDIAVECGNSLYQPVLDRYIGGGDVPFTEVRKVWRNTTQRMCDLSPFSGQLLPLVRAINQKLPTGKRLRVLAGDPPIDWDHIKTAQDLDKFGARDASIASVMEKEVLSKHRKALMLFGTFHLMHGISDSAVGMYEKRYPELTFVISDLFSFDTDQTTLFSSPFSAWPNPSLVRAKGTWLGALDLGHFFPPAIGIDEDCNAHTDEPKEFRRPVEELVDAFLYLGPQDLRLGEETPAYIALDEDYIREHLRRGALEPFPIAGTLREFNQGILNAVGDPLSVVPIEPPDLKPLIQDCLERKKHSKPRAN
jgi:hypothetical protein